MSVVPASQSQGRGDFELCAHTIALKRTHTHILSIPQRETAVLSNQASQQPFNTLDYLLGQYWPVSSLVPSAAPEFPL